MQTPDIALEVPHDAPSAAFPPAQPRRRQRWAEHMASDALIICAALGDWLIAFTALWAVSRADLTGAARVIPLFHQGDGYPVYVALTLISVLSTVGVYGRRRLLNLEKVLSRLGRGFLAWSVFFAGFIGVLAGVSNATLAFSSSTILAAGIGLLAWRLLFHRIISDERIAAHLRQRIVLIGWTPEAGRLAQSIWQHRTDPCEIVGFIELSAAQGAAPANIPFLGELDNLPRILEEHDINVAWLTDVNVDADHIPHLATICEKEMVEFKIIPSYFPILISGLHIETISGTPVLGTDGLPLNHLHNRVLKRLLDLCGALFGMLLAVPIIAIFGALVYIESPGPIFFSQERIGRKGRRFKMYKIRSMRPDAGKMDHLAQSTKRGDPRLLRVGAFMRRWNIDEVPQFWNVLTGEMSLVGPRPERTYHSEKLKEVIPHYNARYTSKPGVTGWAQVNGLRGDTDLGDRIRHDIYYMEHWNLLFDIRIMVMTLFNHKNAC